MNLTPQRIIVFQTIKNQSEYTSRNPTRAALFILCQVSKSAIINALDFGVRYGLLNGPNEKSNGYSLTDKGLSIIEGIKY